MSSTLAIPRALFRERIMRYVYLLISKSNVCYYLIIKMNKICFIFSYVNLVIGIAEFLCATAENFIWTISVKRQISRMNIYLFRSLIQRVSQIQIDKNSKN
jgi:hypothetical protein